MISLTLTANLAARRSPKSQDAVKRIHGRTSPDKGPEPVGRISFQGDSISRPAIGCCPRPLCSIALRHHKHHGDKRGSGLGPTEATGAVARITGTMGGAGDGEGEGEARRPSGGVLTTGATDRDIPTNILAVFHPDSHPPEADRRREERRGQSPGAARQGKQASPHARTNCKA